MSSFTWLNKLFSRTQRSIIHLNETLQHEKRALAQPNKKTLQQGKLRRLLLRQFALDEIQFVYYSANCIEQSLEICLFFVVTHFYRDGESGKSHVEGRGLYL